MAVSGSGCLSRRDADAAALTGLTPLLVAGGGVDLEEVVFDATRDRDQQQPCGRAGAQNRRGGRGARTRSCPPRRGTHRRGSEPIARRPARAGILLPVHARAAAARPRCWSQGRSGLRRVCARTPSSPGRPPGPRRRAPHSQPSRPCIHDGSALGPGRGIHRPGSCLPRLAAGALRRGYPATWLTGLIMPRRLMPVPSRCVIGPRLKPSAQCRSARGGRRPAEDQRQREKDRSVSLYAGDRSPE
jgi:hypothetical protein